MKHPVLIDTRIGERAEEISLGLDEVGGEGGAAEGVVIGKGGGESGGGDA